MQENITLEELMVILNLNNISWNLNKGNRYKTTMVVFLYLNKKALY